MEEEVDRPASPCPLCRPIGPEGYRAKLFGVPICQECEKKLDEIFNPGFKKLFSVSFLPFTANSKQKISRKERERDEAFERDLAE